MFTGIGNMNTTNVYNYILDVAVVVRSLYQIIFINTHRSFNCIKARKQYSISSIFLAQKSL